MALMMYPPMNRNCPNDTSPSNTVETASPTDLNSTLHAFINEQWELASTFFAPVGSAGRSPKLVLTLMIISKVLHLLLLQILALLLWHICCVVVVPLDNLVGSNQQVCLLPSVAFTVLPRDGALVAEFSAATAGLTSIVSC